MVQIGKAERDAQMHARWNDCLTLEAIAREFKVTRETVRLAVRQMERKAMWREIERSAQRERVVESQRAHRAKNNNLAGRGNSGKYFAGAQNQ